MAAIRFAMGTIAVVGLAIGAAACSDDKADTSTSSTTAGAPGGAAPTTIEPTTDETANSGAPATTFEPEAGSKDDVLTPVVGEVLAAAVPALGTDGKVHLAWELVLSNVVNSDVTIDSIVATAGDTALQSLEGDALKGVLRPDGGSFGTTTLTAGQGALVWMEAIVDSYDDVPNAIEHAVSITLSKPNPPLLPPTLTEHIAPFAPVAEKPVVIGAPLTGGRWLDGNGCCALTAHRGAVSPINGRRWAPERWAIDFVRLDEANKLFDGPVDQLSSYAYEGADILAVADGPIVAMVSDRPEQTPGTTPTGLLIDEYGGNYIVQEIGDGRYAFYAHQVPDNPLGLAVGDQLTKGQVLGHLGNSGNSDAPHLHFHVMDRPDPLASNGLPFLIESMEYEGRATSPTAVDEVLEGEPLDIDRTGAGPRPEASPLYLDVVGFPDTGATTRP